MHCYEASLRKGPPASREIPREIEMTNFHGITAAKLYPAVLAAFTQRPIVEEQRDIEEIITDAAFLPDCSFAAWMRDDIVGLQMVRRESEETTYFAYLGVVPAWRHRKIGISLACQSLAACHRAGFQKVTTKVAPDNTEVVGLLRQAHFIRVSSEFNFWLNLRTSES